MKSSLYFVVIDGCWCLSHLLDPNLARFNLYQCLSNRTYRNNDTQDNCQSSIHRQCISCRRGYSGVTSERGHRCYKLILNLFQLNKTLFYLVESYPLIQYNVLNMEIL